MPDETPPDPSSSSLQVARPSMAERLRRIETMSLAGGNTGPAKTNVVYTRPVQEKPVSVLKRLERYFSAFFKLGRTARLAKAASQTTTVLEPRMDAVSEDLYSLTDRQTQLEHERDAVAQRLDRIDDRLSQSAPMLEDAAARAIALSVRMDEMSETVVGFAALKDDVIPQHMESVRRELSNIRTVLNTVVADTAQISRAYSLVSRRLDLRRFQAGEANSDVPPGSPPAREGLDALLESFYGRLEDRYRGSREEIENRLADAYLADIQRAAEETGGRPVLDLGCGRGEWISLLTRKGIAARGVDLNPVQIDEAKQAGLAVEQGDAMAALADAPDGAFSAVTAHHLIEHLPFETFAWMAREALRTLAPGGVLIVETPNVRNLIVGATTFHIDPTHKKPLPAELITTLFDTIGYHPVEARPLHPSGSRDGFIHAGRADPHIAELLFGPQDLAVLATRPQIG